MTDEIAALRAKAEAATKGPYHVTECFDYWVQSGEIGVAQCGDIHWTGSDRVVSKQEQMRANAEYFAACDPATFLALLDSHEARGAEIERLTKERDAARRAGLEEAARVVEGWIGCEAIATAIRALGDQEGRTVVQTDT